MKPMFLLAAASLAVVGAPLAAQDTSSAAKPGADTLNTTADVPPNGDRVTIGAGVGLVPSYEGSDNYVFIPAAAAQGSLYGHRFFTSGTQLSVDLIPLADPNGIHFEAGPTIGVRLNRSGRIKDDRVEALGKRKVALELGGFVGISKTGLITSDYDTLSARLTVVHDVAGIHRSTIYTPSVQYSTPLSTTTFVGLSASMDFVEDGYARTYFSVDGPGSVASGLPAFNAKGGLKSYSLGLTGARSLSGDLRHGLSVFALGAYTRLLNDFSDSPVTNIAGSPNQFFGGLGLGYTF